MKEERHIDKKKKRVYAAMCAALAALEIAAFYLCLHGLAAPVSVLAAANAKIVIDAGHGGIDGGVTGKYTGVKESDLNLEIAYLTAEKFREAGFEAVLTRKTSEGLYGTTAKGFKKRDMQKRREIIEEARPAVVVSIHQNFYPSSFSRGAQAFYLKGSETGAKLAECLQESLNKLYGGRGAPKRNKATGDFFMLSCSEYPSSLVECGFLSNAKDERLLTSDEFKTEIARAIVGGVIAYFAGENQSA